MPRDCLGVFIALVSKVLVRGQYAGVHASQVMDHAGGIMMVWKSRLEVLPIIRVPSLVDKAGNHAGGWEGLVDGKEQRNKIS